MITAMLDKAVELAKTNTVEGLPRLAAILVTKDGEEFYGFNSRKTHPLAAKFGKNKAAICLHAEVDAIRRCLQSGKEVQDSSLFVGRVLRDGSTAIAKPCEGCQRAIVAFGIKQVEWTE